MFMIRRNLLVSSVLLNLGLFGALGYGLRLLHARNESPAVRLSNPLTVSSPVTIAAVAARTETPARTTLTWRQVESSDYRTYITNLRAVGCPEATICEIIAADLGKLYDVRKRALYPGSGKPFQHWRTAERQRISPTEIARWEVNCAELEKEKHAVLAELLGEVCGQPHLITAAQIDVEGRLAFLPEAKRDRLSAIVEKYPEVEDQIHAIVDQRSSVKDSEELKIILERYAQKKAELAQLLTAAEYEQYELNTSWSANNVRSGLAGFNPTAEEFRGIFRIWRAQDGALVTIYATGQPDPGFTGLNNAIEDLLGDHRYAGYQRTWHNPDLHALAELAQDYQLPEDTPARIDSLKQDVLGQQQQIVADSSLTEDQRQAALQRLQAQTEQLMSQQLGVAAYERYVAGTGAWVRDIPPNSLRIAP